MQLTDKQIKWLDSRGGRTIDDVLQDDYGLFVWMVWSDRSDMKIYLPKV